MERRDLIKGLAGGTALNLAGLLAQRDLRAEPTPQEAKARHGLPSLKITNVKAILAALPQIRLVVVEVETNEPGLYGLGLPH